MRPKQNTKQKTNKKSRVFTRIFAYTMLLLVLMSLAAVAVFARQFVSFYRAENRRRLALVFQPVIREFEGKNPEEVAEIARGFYDKNQSFQFVVKDGSGNVLFSSARAEEDGKYRMMFQLTRETVSALPNPEQPELMQPEDNIIGTVKDTYTLLGNPADGEPVDYGDLAVKSLLALVMMIAIGVLGAVLFAWKVTGPLEKELARERLMEENQRLFFSAASHELKTPIAATGALIEGMIANIGDYRNHPKYLRECLKNLDAQNRLVSEILELVKLSDEKAGPLPLPLDLAEIGRALAAEYRPLAEQRGIEIHAALPGLGVRADPGLLHRALSNVVANAVQNTPENGAVRIAAERRGKLVRLSVLNTGACIPAESLDRLFEPFYRPDPARGRNQGRSGLGLTIVKKSLDRMGVPFALENTAEGVVFWLDLEAAG
ncbi:MAG: HAMP domain-containing histidine kinase [Treponema sp.]|jgi:two-component system sensor histidine kinase VanS|nr:HAMP domain-containing histidine kinase [Treponema sp.]